MEKSYLIESKREEFNANVEVVTRALNTALKGLSETLGLSFATVEQARSFDTAALDDFINRSKDALLGNVSKSRIFVPSAIRRIYDEEFYRTRKVALPYIETIAENFAKLEKWGLKPMYRAGEITVAADEVEAKAVENATYNFTPLQMAYVEQLEKVCKSLDELYSFETAHDINHYSRHELPQGCFSAGHQPLSLEFAGDNGFEVTAKKFYNLVLYGICCHPKK